MSSSSSQASDKSSVKRQLLEKVSELAAALEKETAAREEAVARLTQCKTDKKGLLEQLNQNVSASQDSLAAKQDQSTDPIAAERPSVVARDQEILTLRQQLKLVTEFCSKQVETIASLDAKLQFTQEQADKAESSAMAAGARSKRLGREAERAARKQEEAESHTRAVDRITTKAQRLLVILRQTEKHRDTLQDELDSTKQMLKLAMEAKDAAMKRAGNSAAELIECQRQLQEAKAVADLGADEEPPETPAAKAASAESTSGASRHSIDHDTTQEGDQDGGDAQEAHDGQAAEPSAHKSSAGADPAGPSDCTACAETQKKHTTLQRELDAFKQRYYDLQQRALLATDAEAGLERRAEEAEGELRRVSRAAAAAEGELEREKAQRRADAAAHTSSMAGLREECIDLETALRDRRTEVKRLRDAMGEMGDGASRLQQKEEKRESEIARLRATCHRLRAEAVQASAKVHTLRGEAEAEKIRARRAAEEAASLRSELDAAAGRAAQAQRGARLARATAEATAAQLGGALVASASSAASVVREQSLGSPASRLAMKRIVDQQGVLRGGTDSEDQLGSSDVAKQPEGELSEILQPLDRLRALRGADEVAAAVERAFRGALGTAPQADLLAQAAGALSAWRGKEDAKTGHATVGSNGTGISLAGADLHDNEQNSDRGPVSLRSSSNASEGILKRPMEAACWALLGQAAADGVRADRAGLRTTRRRAAAVLARLAFTSREAVGRLTALAIASQVSDGAGVVQASMSTPAELIGAPGSHLDPEVVRVTSLGLTTRSNEAGAGISAASMPSSSLPVARMLFSRKNMHAAELQGAGHVASADAATSKGVETEEGDTPGDVLRMPSCLHASALALGDDGLASVLGALRGATAWESVAGEQQLAARRSQPGLEALDLRHNGITDLGAAAIAGMLADSGRGGSSSGHVAQHRWRLIDLRGNRLTSTGVRDLAEALRDCSSTLGVKHVLVGQDGMLRGLGDLPSRARHPTNDTHSADLGAGTAPLVALIDCRAQRPVHEAAANADKPDSVSVDDRGSQHAAVLHRLPEEDGSILLSARIGAGEVAIGERGQVEIQEQGSSKRDGRMQASLAGTHRGRGTGGSGGAARGSGSLDRLSPYATPPSVLPPLVGSSGMASNRGGRGRGTGGVVADRYGVGDEGKEGEAMAAIDKALAAMGKSQDPMDVIRAADLAIKGRSRMHS